MKLRASTCCRVAREVLSGQWIAAILVGFAASIMGAFTNLISGVLKLLIITFVLLTFCEAVPHYGMIVYLVVFLIALLWTFIAPYIKVGYMEYNLAMLDQRVPENGILFGASSSWWDCFIMRLSVLVRIMIGTIFFVIPGIIVYYNYAMAPFLLEERSNITVSEAMKLSKQTMKGHRWDYFCLRMSFLGWRILEFLTLGIVSLWLNPYYSLSEAVFFNEISGRAEALYDR